MAAAEESKSASGGSGKSNVIIVIIMVFNLLAVGALAYFLMESKKELSQLKEKGALDKKKEKLPDAGVVIKESEEEKDSAPGPMVDLGAIVVNLEGLDGRTYLLKTSIQLELNNEDARREAETKIVQIRWNLQTFLASRKKEEVVGADQMEILRNAMIRKANATLSAKNKGRVVSIWPQEWLVE
jgi:flagellar basal body-associated protein FliL